jgi:hypothetical protein
MSQNDSHFADGRRGLLRSSKGSRVTANVDYKFRCSMIGRRDCAVRHDSMLTESLKWKLRFSPGTCTRLPERLRKTIKVTFSYKHFLHGPQHPSVSKMPSTVATTVLPSKVGSTPSSVLTVSLLVRSPSH